MRILQFITAFLTNTPSAHAQILTGRGFESPVVGTGNFVYNISEEAFMPSGGHTWSRSKARNRLMTTQVYILTPSRSVASPPPNPPPSLCLL
jgi:hypothetical protein